MNASSINFLEYIVKERDSYKSQWSKDFLQKMREMNIKAQKEEISKNNKAFIYKKISDILGDKVVICSDFSYDDVNNQQYFKCNDYRNSVLSGGNGTHGYGFPAAIGAKFSRPSSKVVSISSGTNFQFNMQEMIVALETTLDL